MAVKTIPAKTIKTCDACDIVMDQRTARQEGGLILKAHALDMQGSACADATRRMDLCDSCLHAVDAAVDATIAALHAKAQEEQ